MADWQSGGWKTDGVAAISQFPNRKVIAKFSVRFKVFCMVYSKNSPETILSIL